MKKMSVCICDHGLHFGFAQALAKAELDVFYWCEWDESFPRLNRYAIGTGFGDVKPVESLLDRKVLDAVKESDGFYCFPDIGFEHEQKALRRLGYDVWGSGGGQRFETDREYTKKTIEKIGLPVAKYESVRGLDALTEFAADHPGWWVKFSKLRYHMETFKILSSVKLIMPLLNKLRHELGPMADTVDFIVERDLPDKVEMAVDSFCIDGVWPDNVFVGCEVKDLGYIGFVLPYSQVPEPVTLFDQAIADELRKQKYRNFMSVENRIGKDKKAYPLDPCMRTPSPPGESYPALIKNLAKVMKAGARGEMVQPEYSGDVVVELIIHSTWADKEYLPIKYPAMYEDFVRLRNPMRQDGLNYVIPQGIGLPEVAGVVGIGKTVKQAISRAEAVADSLEGLFLEIPADALEKAEKELEKAKSYGLNIMP